MMKIAHLSDLHFSNDTLEEMGRCLSAAVDRGIQENVVAWALSGDATDHRIEAHSPALIRLVSLVRRMSDHAPVIMLQGTFSHEPPGTLNVFRFIGGQYPVYVSDRIEQVALVNGHWWSSQEVEGAWRFSETILDDSPVYVFSCVPTMNTASVAAAIGAQKAQAETVNALSSVLDGFAHINDALSMAGIPTIGMSHGTVVGCVTEHGQVMQGSDHEFATGDLFAAGCSAFMLGHIHKHQTWEFEGRQIGYAGSIGRLTYGEVDPKGFIVWEVGNTTATPTFHELPARQMLLHEIDGLPDMEMLAALAQQCVGAFTRVRININTEQRPALDAAGIRKMFAGAKELKLEVMATPVVRTRAGGISQALSHAARLQSWGEANDIPVVDELKARLALLTQHGVDGTVALIGASITPKDTV